MSDLMDWTWLLIGSLLLCVLALVLLVLRRPGVALGTLTLVSLLLALAALP